MCRMMRSAPRRTLLRRAITVARFPARPATPGSPRACTASARDQPAGRATTARAAPHRTLPRWPALHLLPRSRPLDLCGAGHQGPYPQGQVDQPWQPQHPSAGVPQPEGHLPRSRPHLLTARPPKRALGVTSMASLSPTSQTKNANSTARGLRISPGGPEYPVLAAARRRVAHPWRAVPGRRLPRCPTITSRAGELLRSAAGVPSRWRPPKPREEGRAPSRAHQVPLERLR